MPPQIGLSDEDSSDLSELGDDREAIRGGHPTAARPQGDPELVRKPRQLLRIDFANWARLASSDSDFGSQD